MIISVILPVYNVKPYLERCLNSIFGQTMTDYELIIIDDGSTDGSEEICDEYAERYPEKTILIHQRNAGLSGARNTGMDYVHGQYTVFIDSDDWIESEMFEKVSDKMSFDGVSYDIIRIGWYEDCRDLSVVRCDDVRDIKDYQHRMMSDEIGSQVWKNVYRSELIKNEYFPFCIYEDLYWTHRIALKATDIADVTDPLYHYTIRSSNISSSYSPTKALAIFNGFRSRYEYVCSDPSYSDLIPHLRSKTGEHALQAYNSHIYDQGKVDVSDAVEFLRINKKFIQKSANGKYKIKLVLYYKCSFIYRTLCYIVRKKVKK